MKKYQILGFLLLIASIGIFQANVYGVEDNDSDGVPNNTDHCPHLQEDYDPQYGNNIDGCPADFVPWYDVDYDGIEDHIDNCPTVKEIYNKFQDDDGCPDVVSDDGTGYTFPDTDSDGIQDRWDSCIAQPENF